MSLQGGVSGANVYVVDAKILFPALENEVKPKPLKFVIKFSSGQDFDLEKEKYGQLPSRLKKWFVDFATHRVPVDGKFFMIMPHLREHKTLAFIVYHSSEELRIREATQKAWEALEDVHFGRDKDEERNPCEKKPPSIGKLSSMYLADIHSSLQKTNKLAKFFPSIESMSLEVNGQKLNQPSFYLDKLWKASGKVTPCFSMWTHGDCHSRNIMIREKDMDVKFIDIDQLQYDGDYIYDYGVLLADIEIYNRVLQCRRPNFALKKESKNAYSYLLPELSSVNVAIEYLLDKLERRTKVINDEQWKTRLDLAKARYLLSMCSKTIDREKAFIVYCEGLKALASSVGAQETV